MDESWAVDNACSVIDIDYSFELCTLPVHAVQSVAFWEAL